MKRILTPLIVACMLALSLPHISVAQATGGAVAGVVRNQAGEAVSGARITARNLNTNQTRMAETDSEGAYRLPSLAVGSYEITVEADDYAKAFRQVTLLLDQQVKVSFDLVVEGAAEGIDVVSSNAPLVESSNSVLGVVIENKQISNLPINGRNFLQLGTLVANVSSTASLKGGAEGGILNGPFAVAGQRDRSLTFLVDGVDNNNSLSNSLSAQVSIDAVQEFKMVTNLGSAEHGYHSGGMINILTKPGTNDLHFTLFEFFRNKALNWTNHFEKLAGKDASRFNNNQFGGTLSGPLVKDRVFYLASYEGQRLRSGNPHFSNVPTEQERQGIFKNPVTGQVVQVPVDPVAALIIDKYIPHPNTESEFGNYLATPTIRARNDFAMLKAEYLIGGNDEITLRYFVSDNDLFDPIITNVFLSNVLPPTVPGFGLNGNARTHNLAVTYARHFSTRMINEFRFGYNRHFNFLSPEDAISPSDLGFQHVTTPTGLFDINISGISRIGNNVLYPIHFKMGNFHLADSFAIVRGRHSAKFGGDLRLLRMYESISTAGSGTLSFSGISTRISPLADLVKGVAAAGSINLRNVDTPMRQTQLALFLHDDYQVTSRLVLNYGLRYELGGVLESPTHRLTNFSIERGFFTPGLDTQSGLYKGDHNNFAPRLGFAFLITGDGRTVLRGGYGIYYDNILFTTAVNLNLNQVGDPWTALSIALPGQKISELFNPATLVKTFTSVSPKTYDENMRTPYAQHFNLILQRDLGKNMLLSVGYVGTKSTKLTRVRDINQAIFIPGTDAAGRPLSTAANITARRPTQLFKLTEFPVTAILQEESSASSIYHSFQATFTKRLSNGLSILSAYTWSKSIDNATDSLGFTGDTGGPQNSHDIDQERGLSVFDIRQRVTIGYSYEIPLKGNRWVEGWQVNGTASFQSGQPFSLVLGFDRSLTASLNARPNHVPGAIIKKDGQLFFDPNLPLDPVRKIPVALIPDVGQFGTLGRNTFTGDGYHNLDISVLKQTPLGERLKMQTRFEVFNLLNTTNLALPQRKLTDPFFGLSRKTQDAAGGVPGIGGGGPRLIQLVVRFIF